MNKKYMKFIVALISLNILFTLSTFGQGVVVVKDVNGNPVQGVSVTVGEGTKPVLTNEKGEFTLKIDSKTSVLLEAEGYDPQMVVAFPAVPLESVIMIKPSFQMGSKDVVKVPFGSFKKRQIPGSVTGINIDDLIKYDQVIDFNTAILGRVPGFFGSSDNRGLGAPLVIVDGVPRAGLDYNIQMIDQISIERDLAGAMLYGGQANNGIIYITTKRGQPLKKNLNFLVSSGVNDAISYPKYLSASEYMSLYNEALANDGLSPKYNQSDIDATASGQDPVRWPDEEYYNSRYLKDYAGYFNMVGEASGGNEIAQYYLNVGWARSKSFLKVGNGDNEKRDKINVRGNVDYKLNNVVKIRFDAAVVFNLYQQPRYTTEGTNFWTLSSSLFPNSAPVLIPASLMKDPTLQGAAVKIDNEYILGGTSEYLTNMYGELMLNNVTKFNHRLLEMNIGLDFDLNTLTKGLTASLFLTYDLQNIFRTDILNSYAVYQPNYKADTISSWSKYNVDVKVNTQTLSDVSFLRKNGIYGKIDYHRLFGAHEVSANAIGYFDQYSLEGVLQPTKHLNFALRANYNYKEKYIAEFTGVVMGSTKLNETQQWGFAPGMGLGWVVSEEGFLNGNSFVNYLKLRTNIALTNNDEYLNSYFPGHDIYTTSTQYNYNNGAAYNKSVLLSLGNQNLGFEKRLNYNIGFDAFLLDTKIGIEGAYFYYKTYDVVTQRTNYYPVYFGSYYYENYGSYQNQGAELGLNYTQNFGDVRVRFGTNFVYSVPKTLQVDEINYTEDYRKATGKPTDAMFGYVALGLFQNQADIDNSVPQTFGTVKPGDIKYEDLNGDNVIDDLDQKMIGNSHARFEYSFNLSLKYKAFELFALATGQSGMDNYTNSPYYWVYGTRKYSEVVSDRWTPATASSAAYPRLTTLSNDNNYRNSTFWLYNNDWFTLQTVQFTYTMPLKINGINEAQFFIRGNNLLTVSKNKDKSQLNVATAPQTRFYSLGITVML
jgi:TonB-linked SusC/RagA family outer membrane protein